MTRPGKHICPYCQRPCSKPSVLEKHIRAHTGERPYPCSVCGFSFKTKSNLYKHCKSRAHLLKCNVEMNKKKHLAGSESTSGTQMGPILLPKSLLRASSTHEMIAKQDDLDVLTDTDSSPGTEGYFKQGSPEKDKRPLTEHVMQEVVKYLGKDKDQRPNEVQTEKQRARLERIKSLHVKDNTDLRRREITGIQRQMSLPIFPTSSPIPNSQANEDEELNSTKIMVPEYLTINENGEIVTVSSGNQSGYSLSLPEDGASNKPPYPFKQVFNLPEPNSDPEKATKALYSLEDLSDKLAKEGTELSTSVRSLPDKRVQIVLELTKSEEGETQSQNQALSITRNNLKERIQKLILTNEAIIDTPKLEPPRAKVVRRNISRQESEPASTSTKSETETSAQTLSLMNQSARSFDSLTSNSRDVPQRQKSVILENSEVPVRNNNVIIIEEDAVPRESIRYTHTPDGQLVKIEQIPVTVSAKTVKASGRGMFASKLRPGLDLPLTTTCLPHNSTPILAAHLNRTHLTQSIYTSAINTKSHSISSFPSPAHSKLEGTILQSPSPIGQKALKNFANRSKSLSSSQGSPSPSPLTPVASSVVYALPTPSQSQYIFQAPVQTVTTPSLPVQVLLPGSTMPMLLVGENSAIPSPKVPMQQTILLQSPQTPNFATRIPVTLTQTPIHTPTQQFFPSAAPTQTVIIQQSPHTPTIVSAPGLTNTVFSSRVSFANQDQSGPLTPVTCQIPVTDPMKILSSIVSSTVNKQREISGQKAKEIKIEIKLPTLTAQSSSQTIPSSHGFTQKPRPKILKRQSSVSSAKPPIQSPSPLSVSKSIFRLESPVLAPTTPSSTPTLRIQPLKFPTVSQQTSIGKFITTEEIRQKSDVSLVKDYYSHISSAQTVSKSATASQNVDQHLHLVICPHCGISFKKEVTLNLHVQYYCKNRNQTSTDRYKLQSPSHSVDQERTETANQTPVIEELAPVSKWPISRLQNKLSSVKEAEEPKVHTINEKMKVMKASKTFDGTSLAKSKLKGQILKRKLKGKILMHRSLSVDPLIAKEVEKELMEKNKDKKTKSIFTADTSKETLPVKKALLRRSVDDFGADGIVIKRPTFQRSKSVPSISVSTDTESFDEGDEKVEKETETKAGYPNISVPVKTAHYVVADTLPKKPIYQQNFRMRNFEGMGTPVQLVPSATLTPRPELMEIEKVRKMFTFDASMSKLFSKPDSQDLLKSPAITKESYLKSISNQKDSEDLKKIQSPIKSPMMSPDKVTRSPFLRQFSLVGHAYPSMRSMTHLTFCTTDRLQPSYVKANKKVSMYSNWRVASQNNNPLGLATRAVLSLYDSCYTTDPVWVTNCGIKPRNSLITHSSYWKDKCGESKDDRATKVSLDLLKKTEKLKSKLQGGYKSSKAYVYVRGRGRGRYVCETCGIRCRKPSMLKKHIRTHTNLRPFKCKQCKFSFKTKGNLTKHMKSKTHIKKCLNLGISPVPITVDDTQIDAGALAEQCKISKQAKIVDEQERSMEESDGDMMDDGDDIDDEDDGECDMSEDESGMGESMDMQCSVDSMEDSEKVMMEIEEDAGPPDER